MATNKELQDQLDDIRQKRADLSSQVTGLNIQHSNSNAQLLGSDFAAMDKIRFNSALKPLLMQDRVLHQQEQQLTAAINKSDREQKQAVAAKNQADRAAAQAQRQQAAQQKQAAANLEDASARQFGIGPKKGIDYVTQQGAFYDPATGQVAVPDNKAPKTAKEKEQKGDAAAGKQVQSEITGFAKQAGVTGPVNAASFFGDNGFDMEQDKDGNYVYDVNGTPVTIPEQTAERLQEQYNASLPPPQDETPAPSGGVKYIPTDAFQQANQALNQLKGTNVVSPVDRYLASQSMNRQAAPAVAEANAEAAGTPRPATVPSVTPNNPDLSTTINTPSFGQSLLAPVDPSFANYAANQKAAALVPSRVALSRGGTVSPADVVAASDTARQILGADADPDQLKLAANAALDQIEKKNQAQSSLPYDAASKIVSTLGPQADAIVNLNPVLAYNKAIGNLAGRGYDAVASAAGLGPLFMGRDQRTKDEIAKQNIVDKVRSAISPDEGGVDETAPFLEY